jgi:oligopeptide/dipeptide ABC transporter ATP-binding protein
VERELAPGLNATNRVASVAAPGVGAAPILAVRDLTVSFTVDGRERRVVAGIGYDIAPGRTLGVVGESGCGKSMTALSVMGLVPSPGRVGGSIRFEGHELVGQPEAAWRTLRGDRIAMVFQEPMTALNPVMPVGRQIAEVLVLHEDLSWRDAGARAVEMLQSVGIPSPARRARDYPHQLSGGQRQRAMIAMALACRPALLVADEPTTALDVTIQAQILDLMLDLQERIGTAVQFISHNLAVISEISHEIIVMYAGRIVERAPAEALFANPLHPYTQGLIATLPDPGKRVDKLPVIRGGVPDLSTGFQGCRFADRCPRADDGCRAAEPPLEELAPGHFAACWKARA